MEKQYPRLEKELVRRLTCRPLLAKLELTKPQLLALLERRQHQDQGLEAVFAQGRCSCRALLEQWAPVLEAISPCPADGWLAAVYRLLVGELFPQAAADAPQDPRGLLLYLEVLCFLLEQEKLTAPFDPMTDFAFLSPQELAESHYGEEYARFLELVAKTRLEALLRIGREIKPFDTLSHIAGVHHVAMHVARQLCQAGLPIDLGLVSAAAAGHDIGKFGCRPAEFSRIPYLHYYYTDQWFQQGGMPAIGHVAVNHSTWDLELENLPVESLVLIYADFRVKRRGTRPDGGEEIGFYSLDDAFQVILEKLDNVDQAKEQRYRHVYSRLHDFEDYMGRLGVNTDLTSCHLAPPKTLDLALRTGAQMVETLKNMAIEHNIRLMHKLSREISFGSMLEDARSETDWKNIRATLNIFQEYFTYMTQRQKEMTLAFLYELLMNGDGAVRRQAAALMGRMIVRHDVEYRKELPQGVCPSPDQVTGLQLWRRYLGAIVQPDHKLTAKHKEWIGAMLRAVVEAAFRHCLPREAPAYRDALLELYRQEPEEDRAAAVLLDAALCLPGALCGREHRLALLELCLGLCRRGSVELDAGVLRVVLHLASMGETEALQPLARRIFHAFNAQRDITLLFLMVQAADALDLGEELALLPGCRERLYGDDQVLSEIFLENLKTATPWAIKEVNIDFLLAKLRRGGGAHVLHVATHLANLIKVSGREGTTDQAGRALVEIAPLLTLDQRNEIAIELTKGLEVGEDEFSKEIPAALGQFALYLHPQELDEVLGELGRMVKSASHRVGPAAISALGILLQKYPAYRGRFAGDEGEYDHRRRVILGMLLSGLAHYHQAVSEEALLVVSRDIFACPELDQEVKDEIFLLIYKKVATLLAEQDKSRLRFFNNAACLNHFYRFITSHQLARGPFVPQEGTKVAFFPGTFDPFSLGHKGIVREIRNMGFTVYLALDEFSWSKRTQPRLVRRKIVNMSVADLFDVYLFPDDIPVNIANPGDLRSLGELFPGRELYIAVGSDVVLGASSYKAAPSRDSIHHLNHIIFRRNAAKAPSQEENDLIARRVLGKQVELRLPPYLEDVSSTRIRENIDQNRDISNLIDPVAQKFIYDNSLYLRSPQYKSVLRGREVQFRLVREMDRTTAAALLALVPQGERPKAQEQLARSGTRTMVMEDEGQAPVGFALMHQLSLSGLYDEFGSAQVAHAIRRATSGKIVVLGGIYTRPEEEDATQQLLTESLAACLKRDYTYAIYHPPGAQVPGEVGEVLEGQGFLPVPGCPPEHPAWAVDMKFPIALIRDLDVIIRPPLDRNKAVLEVCAKAHRRLEGAMTRLFPGTLVLTFTASTVNRRLMEKITRINGVPNHPLPVRTLGKYMCVPYGKILRGVVVPNTVTKTLHTEKFFDPEIRRFTIEEYPFYSPLMSQIRTIKSFERPVLLVDDLLHKGFRLRELDPLFKQAGLPIKKIIVGIMSGRGKDLMSIQHRQAESVYFIPNLRMWFVESTLYPFIGGDSVRRPGQQSSGWLTSINHILPYVAPGFLRECSKEALYQLSQVCMENARDILQALEQQYQRDFERNLTLSRLSEALVYPRRPDKGDRMSYDPGLSPSVYVENDLELLHRLGNLVE